MNPPPFVSPPKRLPFPWGWILSVVEHRLGKPLPANRILGWSPRLLAGTGVMEALVIHDDRELPRRLLKILRVYASYSVSCPFCIDLNAHEHAQDGVSDVEIAALASGNFESFDGFSAKEKAALWYASCLTATPVRFPDSVILSMKQHFSDRAFTLIAATVAQVNFWARLIQGLGVSESGFSTNATLLELDRFRTRLP